MAAAAISKTISFADIVKGRDASVKVTDDGLVFAVDLVVVMTNQERNHAAKTLRNIPDELFHSQNFIDRQLSSRYKSSVHHFFSP